MKLDYSNSVIEGVQITLVVFLILMILKLFEIVISLPGLLPIPVFLIFNVITLGLLISFSSLIWLRWKKIKEDLHALREQNDLMIKMLDLQSANLEKNLKIYETLSKLEAMLSKEGVGK